MKFGLISVALLVVGALGVRSYLKGKAAPPAPAKLGQAHQTDPYATLEDQSGPLDAATTDAITEAAYHQSATEWFPSMGADENAGGEELILNQ